MPFIVWHGVIAGLSVEHPEDFAPYATEYTRIPCAAATPAAVTA